MLEIALSASLPCRPSRPGEGGCDRHSHTESSSAIPETKLAPRPRIFQSRRRTQISTRHQSGTMSRGHVSYRVSVWRRAVIFGSARFWHALCAKSAHASALPATDFIWFSVSLSIMSPLLSSAADCSVRERGGGFGQAIGLRPDAQSRGTRGYHGADGRGAVARRQTRREARGRERRRRGTGCRHCHVTSEVHRFSLNPFPSPSRG